MSYLLTMVEQQLFVLSEPTNLQPILFVIGLAIVGVPFLPSIRRWYAVGR